MTPHKLSPKLFAAADSGDKTKKEPSEIFCFFLPSVKFVQGTILCVGFWGW